MLIEFLFAWVLFLLVFAGMALGVLRGGSGIAGSCGGLNQIQGIDSDCGGYCRKKRKVCTRHTEPSASVSAGITVDSRSL